jgi:hypothetical protein
MQLEKQRPTPRVIPITEMRSLYTLLGEFNRLEFQLEMAREAARLPVAERLANRFRRSVEQFCQYENYEPFYPQQRTGLPLLNPQLNYPINCTSHLTSLLINQNNRTGEASNPDLNFTYIDREIKPARTTGGAIYTNLTPATSGKTLDWLLSNANDQHLIIGEVKIDNDKNPFYALIQTLMYAAELVTVSQQRRLMRYYPDSFQLPDQNAITDIYIILHNYDWECKVRNELFELTNRISNQLMHYQAVSSYIRRIACLDARLNESGIMFFQELFSCEAPRI